MLKNWNFHAPTQVVFGPGAFRQTAQHVRALGQRVLVVLYQDQTGLEPAVQVLLDDLGQAKLTVSVFDQIVPDPPPEQVAAGAQAARANDADCVVALGGGSAMDAAKGIALLAVNEGGVWDYTRCNPEVREVRCCLPIVAIPTTAGTGSEVTNVAVFSQMLAHRPELGLAKAAVADPAIIPRVALVDPELMCTAPPALTAACGIDALSHALAAFQSRAVNPPIRCLAAEAIRLIMAHLRTCVEDGDNLEARTHLALASNLGGLAIAHAGCTIEHTVAHALGGLLHVPHGVAIAQAMETMLRYCLPAMEEGYGHLARLCGLVDGETSAAERFVEEVVRLIRAVGIPGRPEWPTDGSVTLDQLVDNGMTSVEKPVQLTPRKVTREDLRQMFQQVVGSA